MRVVLCNAFSLNMMPPDWTEGRLWMIKLDGPEVAAHLLTSGRGGEDAPEWESAVGHADTARVMGELLGLEVPMNRMNVVLTPETPLIVGQYTGPRLPEGATTLPEGGKIEWWWIQLSEVRNA